MKKTVLYIFLLASLCGIAQVTTPISIGESVTITSEILKQDRTLNIYLPATYDTTGDKKYDVIYLLDGGMDEDFLHIAGLVQFANFSWIQMIPETIVVGIVNIDRKHDLTFPSNSNRDTKEFPTTGGSADFIQFITEELQPYIAANYTISETKTLIGQSLGGLLASEILLKQPSAFTNYIIVSPSTWWDDESILKLEPQVLDGFKNIHISVGKEGPMMETGATRLYYNLLQAHPVNATISYEYLQEQNHGNALHLSVYKAFQKLSEAAIKEKN
jgi:predicted alpha/beta superfamily hydrolase